VAFPFISEANFEDGTKQHFDTETDTESRLDFVHYTTLASNSRVKTIPFRGAYCMRVALENDGTPADAYLQETGDWDLAADGTIWFRFCFFLSADTVMANADEFAIFQLWSGASTVEGGAYINFTTANGFRIGIGEATATSFKPLTLGVWHQLELSFNIDAGGGNDGTIDAFLDNSAFTQVTALDQGAVTSGVIGVLSQDAGTTAGTLLIDQVVADDARIFPITNRFTQEILLTKSSHIFVGPGEIESVELYSGASTDNVVSLWDTDQAYTSDASMVKAEIKNTVASQRVPHDWPDLRFYRGCYVVLSGTNPRALLRIRWAECYSPGAARSYARSRTMHPFGA